MEINRNKTGKRKHELITKEDKDKSGYCENCGIRYQSLLEVNIFKHHFNEIQCNNHFFKNIIAY